MNEQSEVQNVQVIQVVNKRWIVLGVFSLTTLLNAFNWIEYSIVQDVIIYYYNQSLPESEAQKIDAVNWFSMVYMLCYIPLVFPAMFLLERKGLKLSCCLGALLTFIGSAVKCAAVRQDLFAVAMFAQTICAIAQAFTLGIPARLSALWFGDDQIGLATSIGVFGNQLGTAIGFVVPPLLLVKTDPINILERNFYYLLITAAVLCGITFLLCLIFVKDQPEVAPSVAQWEVRNNLINSKIGNNDIKIFKESLINLFKNYNFVLILISYGINTGAYYAIGTLLNLIISNYYENENENIGLIGLILIVSGLIGSIVCGFILDRTKAYKLTTFMVYLCSFLAMVLFTFTLNINIWIIFATTFLLGFFMTGYLPVGFELAAEITYPISEGTSCGLLNTSAQVFGMIFTYSQGRIIYNHGSLAGNIFIISALLIGTIITGFIKSDFRRQDALKLNTEKNQTITQNIDSIATINSNLDVPGPLLFKTLPIMESHHENYLHFRNTLFAELTQNLKPVIISLTMLAEDYCRSDVYIAKAIEEYIDEVSPDIKILGLYLIDSIMKNFKTNTSYIKIFERNIVSLFERVFKAVDENNRKALYKLRQTWLDLFNEQTLYDLDMRVKKIDQAWPITARVPVYVPTVVKPPVREVSQPPPQPLPVKKAESIPVKPVNSHKKSLFEVELESIPKNKNPIVKTTSQTKSPAKSIVNNKTKSESVKTSPVKNEKSPETKKQVMKQPIVNKLNNGEKKPIPANLTNNKKQKISPTTKLAAATITTSNDKQIIKKPIQKSPPVESKKEKPPEIIPKPSSGMKHPIVDKKDINSENVKRIKLTEPPRIVEKETIAEPTKDVDLRFMTQASVVETTVEPAKIINIDINFVKNLLEDPSLKQILNNRTNQDQVVKEIDNEKKSSSPPTPPAQPVPQMETLAIEEKQNDEEDLSDFPPIRPKDISENSNDSLLIIDARSYRIQPNVSRTIKIYYHDHEVYCDTKNKDVYVDQKLVAKMGDNTKEIMLNGRRVRLMYMGKRIELWIDGMSFHFRADSPPKQISLSSSMSNQTKRYFVTIDSRTMDMYFNNFKVCTINGGPYGNGPSILMARLAPDDYEQHEISFVCPPKRVMIDGIHRKMRYDLPVPCIEMYNGQFHIIRFTGPPRDIYIDGQPYKVPFDKTVRIKLNGRAHELAWGGPGFEVIIDGRPYEVQFNKPEREIIIGTRAHSVCIYGEAPEVKICGRLPKEFCEKAQQTELKPTIVKPPPLMSQPMTIPTDPSIIKVAETITRPQVQKLQNVHDLLSKLKEYNILPGVGKPEKKDEDLKVPDLTSFDPEMLKQKYTAAFKNLYSGNQCAECGNRFNKNDTSNTSSRYSKHLDWHFRQNKKEKEEINKARSRAWYYTLKDWVLFEEISDEQVVSTEGQIHPEDLVRENSQDSMVTDEPPNRSIFVTNGVKTCAATDDIGDSCCICNDPFEIFWYSEKEEWHFKDAIRVDNKIYHPICYEDKKEENEANQINNEICTPVKCEPV